MRHTQLLHQHDGLKIERATEAALDAALNLQFQRLSDSERTEKIQQLEQACSRGDIDLHHCLTAHLQGQLAAAQLLVRQADGTFYIWPVELSTPFCQSPEAENICAQLYAEARNLVDESDAWIAQSLLEPDDRRSSRELEQHGFPRLTELLFMGRSLDRPIEAPPHQMPDLTSEPFDELSNQHQFAHVIEQSYIGSMDCAELNSGPRSGSQSLATHKLSGQFEPARWRLYRDDQGEAGVLLQSEHAPDGVWEIVYFGVVPRRRGNGIGRAILIDGLRTAQRAGAHEIVLAVDVRNAPALRLYDELGFERFDRRVVHARILSRSPGAATS